MCNMKLSGGLFWGEVPYPSLLSGTQLISHHLCLTLLTSRCRLSVLQEQYAVCNKASNIKQWQQGCIRQFANPVEKNFKSPISAT